MCVLYYTNEYSCLVTSHPLFREACPAIVSDNDVTAPFAAIVAIIQSRSTWSKKKRHKNAEASQKLDIPTWFKCF